MQLFNQNNTLRCVLALTLLACALRSKAQPYGVYHYVSANNGIGFTTSCAMPDGNVAVGQWLPFNPLSMIAPDGRVVWSNVINGAGRITDIRVANDGNLIVLMDGGRPPFSDVANLYKVNAANGTIIWGRTFRPAASAVVSAVNGYIVVSDSPTSLLRLNEQGDFLWQKNTTLDYKAIGRLNFIASRTMLRAADGDHWLFQSSENGAQVVRLRQDTLVVQRNLYTSADPSRQYTFQDMSLFGDGGQLLLGTDGLASFVVRINPDGSVRWAKTLTFPRPAFTPVAVATRQDGSSIIVGSAFGSNDSVAFVVKLTPDGSPVWSRGYVQGNQINFLLNISITPSAIVAVGYYQNREPDGSSTVRNTMFRFDADGLTRDCCEKQSFQTGVTDLPIRQQPLVTRFSIATNTITPTNSTATPRDITRAPNPCRPINMAYTPPEGTLCPTECVELKFPNPTPGVRYTWKFVGAQPDTFTGAQPGRICYGTQNGRYPITLSANEGCMIRTDTVAIDTKENEEPNVFTPNDDGVNDVFSPVLFCPAASEYVLEIFNRWGQRIFTSTDPDTGWDGTVKGQPAPSEVYIWRTRYQGWFKDALRDYNRQGEVTLLR